MGAQHLQPGPQTYVNQPVKQINPHKDAGVNGSNRRFVKVAPPTIHAGIGNALRQAFRVDSELRSLTPFEDLLARLD